MAEINIIGAGITGLSAAVKIIKTLPNAKINIFEASDNAGGRLKSFKIKEWDREIYNPHLLSGANVATRKYFECIGIHENSYRVKWETTSWDPFLMYRLFVESVQNTAYANADKKQAFFLFFKALCKGMSFYYAEPNEIISHSINFIKNHGGNIFFNRKLSSIEELPKNKPIIIATDACNCKRLSNLSSHIKSLPIVNIHYNMPCPEKKVVLCPNFTFPCVIFGSSDTISVTVSAADKIITYRDENIAKIFWQPTCKIYKHSGKMPEYKIIKNKRATAKFMPELTEKSNFIIAGDFLNKSLPPTIESSIISGNTAALKAIKLSNLL